MVFLIFVGVYILTLPAYYFLVLHGVGDALMPFEVTLCLMASIGSVAWVFKLAFGLKREIGLGKQANVD